MILDVYIGSLKDRKFSWDGRDWNGNVPRQRSPDFPDGDKAFWEVRRRITKGDLDGKQTDWGGWVARCNKSQIEAIIRDLYEGHPWYEPGSTMPHMEQRLKDLKTYVGQLNDDDVYALVTTEL
jgi:hypothetical protein